MWNLDTEGKQDSWNPFQGILTDDEIAALGEKLSGKSREEVPDCCAWLAALGSDNSVAEDNYTTGRCHTSQGRALAAVRAGYIAGKAVLKVSATGLGETCVEVQVQP